MSCSYYHQRQLELVAIIKENKRGFRFDYYLHGCLLCLAVCYKKPNQVNVTLSILIPSFTTTVAPFKHAIAELRLCGSYLFHVTMSFLIRSPRSSLCPPTMIQIWPFSFAYKRSFFYGYGLLFVLDFTGYGLLFSLCHKRSFFMDMVHS